jgi:hypothetical protein
MKKHISKRVLTLVLALVLVFALSLGAFAAWNSFQGNNDNNGTISVAPPTSTPTVTAVDLSMHNPYGDVYSGVDAETVMNNGVAYTLYNGGISSGLVGGARLRATTVSSGAQVWDIQLDASVNNESQLATPYLDTASGKLYTTVTMRTPIVDDYSVSGWSTSGNATIDAAGVATFAAGGGAISKTITIDTVNYLYLPTNLSGTDGNYTITLQGSGTPITLASGYVSSWGTYDSYTGTQIPAGTYTLKVEVTGNTAAATMNQVVFSRYDWRLYCVSNLSAAYPTVTRLLGSDYIDPGYEGQINTPIYSDGDGNIYFGVYGGTHSYFQLNTATLALAQFTPSVAPGSVGEDFYWAGAVKVTDSSNVDYIVFGSESGLVYVREKNDFANSGTDIDLYSLASEVPGQIRSSMVAHAGKVYFTSKGTPYGWIWSINTAAITSPAATDVAVKTVYQVDVSVSTPVISDNGIVYIGTNNYNPTAFTTTGRIEAYALDLSCITQAIYSGDPVQASPIVYTVGNWDYIYFTTNSYTGAGYCYRFNGSTNVAQLRWTAGGTSANRYTLQGFSSDDGYLIYGDDSGRLYIMD